MNFLNKNTKPKTETIALFDIGTSSVGCAFVNIPDISSGAHPTIIFSTRVDLPETKELNYQALSEDMIVALKKSNTLLYEQKCGAPSKIVCSLASPWYETIIKKLKISKEHSFVLNDKIITELAKKEVDSVSLSHKQNSQEEMEIIEQSTLSVLLNGYHVDNPIGKRTKSAEINMVISVSPKSFLDSVRKVFEKNFHSTPVVFSSFVLDSYIAVSNRYTELDAYALVDIGGDITDIAIVNKGVFSHIVSFPFGKKTVLKYISNKLDISLRDSKELLHLFSTGMLKENIKHKMLPLMSIIEKMYLEAFLKSIHSITDLHILSNPMFVTVDADISAWFTSVLQNDNSVKFLFYNNECTVLTLENKDFIDICKLKDCVCDPFLMIEAIAYSKKK